MELKLFPIPFVIFPLPSPSPSPSPSASPCLLPNQRRPTEIRFARWNNANAKKFEDRRRAQEEIEADIRRHRRFTAATNLSSGSPPTSPPASPYFKSLGTPSSPSKPSIPGRKSKYSKPEPTLAHPAFRNPRKITVVPPPKKADVKLGNDGVSYVIEGAPFEFQYSYTETPKVKPIKLREAAFTPFGPEETPRPWTGRAPLPSSKKKVREFDSFQLPPPDKKGVKPVQSPGPYLAGSGPRYAKSREELLGEPLTPEEVKDLVDGCLKSKRQLNMGRDGLTHNMLDNIHAHWKRRRVCKIKCKGVCTVDMENVCQQLEERTGGKIIYRKGGVLYLFRGRNYNFRTCPRFPLMLWKPVTPVYPRLIQRAPAGLTLEEASDMRKRGRKLIPICKLGKNGVYSNLLRHVREAFGECELVRINCQGMNGSDYRKIGAKLRDLVPCVLISFEREHILMWRGREWKSSNMRPINNYKEAMGSDVDGVHAQSVDDLEIEMLLAEDAANDLESRHTSPMDSGQQEEDLLVGIQEPESVQVGVSTIKEINESENSVDNGGNLASCESEIRYSTQVDRKIKDSMRCVEEVVTASSLESDTGPNVGSMQDLQEFLRDVNGSSATNKLPGPHVEGVLRLWKQAIESGSALVLVDGLLDADNVYQSAVAFAGSATPGPVFRHRPRKVVVQKCEIEERGDTEANELAAIAGKVRNEKKSFKPPRAEGVDERYLDEVPKSQGSLTIDELAKLLA